MKKHLKLKSKSISFIVIFLLTIIVLYFSLKDNFNSVVNQFLNLNLFWLLIGFILIVGYWFFASLSMHLIARKFSNNLELKEVFRINVVTHFFNAVTPFSSGGQPYQIYALKKNKINIVDCTNITIQNFVAYQSALIILGTLAIIFNHVFDLFPDIRLLRILVIIGYLVNLFVAIGLFAISFTQKLNRFILKIMINIGTKFKLIKDKEEAITRFNSYVSQFHNSTKLLLKDKKNLVKIVLCNLIGLICLYAVPLAVLYSTGDFTSFSFIMAIISSAYVMIIGAFVPLPGGTGGLEYSFMSFFGNFVADGKLTTLMLMWRFITYYFGMIVGAIVLNFSRRQEK